MSIQMDYRTPIQQVQGFDESDNELYIKREDLLPFSFGGNKVRIAFEFFKDMKAQGKNALIMYGDRHSNLCRVLSNLCAKERVPCLMIATSEDDGGVESFNQVITGIFGPEIMVCRKDRIAEAVDEAYRRFEACGRRPYYIFGNRLGVGNEGTAAVAYADVYREIVSWEQAHEKFDMIGVPYGTGSTMGGLIAGTLETGHQCTIVGISVSSRTEERAVRVLRDTVAGYFVKKQLDVPSDIKIKEAINLQCGYNLGGYGLYDNRVLQVCDRMLLENGIAMDPIYTGKAFRGMLDYLSEHEIHGKRLLFLHTGGLPLFFDGLADRT